MPTHSPPGQTFSLTDPVGLDEIGKRLGVAKITPYQWRARNVLPPPLFTVSRCPVWDWSVIETWARRTRRIRPDGPERPDITRQERSSAAILLGGQWS